MAKTVTGYSQWFVEATAAAAREAWRLFGETGCAQHWLYYKPNGLAFKVAQEKPEGFELCTPEHVPSNLEMSGLNAWITRNTSRVPVLPVD